MEMLQMVCGEALDVLDASRNSATAEKSGSLLVFGMHALQWA